MFLESFLIGEDEINMKYAKLFERAKQMERKQIEESFNVGWFESQKPSSVVEYSSASKYFNKKYNNGKNS